MSALKVFEGDRLPEVKRLTDLRPPDDPTNQQSHETATALNRAAVVVLVAHLEGFVEDLIDDLIDAVHAGRPAVNKLPARLIASQLVPEIQLIAEMQDPNKIATRVSSLLQLADGYRPSTLVKPGLLSSDAVTKGMSNPGGKEIERLFAIVGVESVLEPVELPDGSGAVKRANEIVGIRNAIAHGGNPSITSEQTDRYVDSVSIICRGLHERVQSHANAICEPSSSLLAQ